MQQTIIRTYGKADEHGGSMVGAGLCARRTRDATLFGAMTSFPHSALLVSEVVADNLISNARERLCGNKARPSSHLCICN